jgi:hypothetical protein
VRDDVEPFIADGTAAFDADAEGVLPHPTKSGFNRHKLLLTDLSEFLQDLVVVAFDGTVVVIAVARLFKVMLDPLKASLQLLLSSEEDRPVLFVAMLQIQR